MKRTSQVQGRVYVAWIQAFKEALDAGREWSYLSPVRPTQLRLF
jgi:hypothetical protein